MSLKAAAVGRTALQSRLFHNSKTAVRNPFQRNNGYNKNNERPFWLASQPLHTFAGRLSLEDSTDRRRAEQRRLSALPSVNTGRMSKTPATALVAKSQFHTSAPTERAAAIILGLGAVSATFYAGATAVRAYQEYKASIPDTPPPPPPEEEAAKDEPKQEAKKGGADSTADTDGKRENVFSKWFGVGVGAKYYEGGFEDGMTRREAALILGVRESSSPKRIKDAHRKLLILNHPDAGGSSYMAAKINEAKELLLKGRRRV